MELQVRVEQSLRVVCGVTRNTRCEEVVIALAQDLGQTGRYVLVLQVRGSERQLLRDQCPVEELSALGVDAADALLVLRRTGPSATRVRPLQDRPRTRTPDPLPSRRKDPEDGSLYGTFPQRGTKTRSRQVQSVQKEDLCLQLLHQDRTLLELEEELQRLTRDLDLDLHPDLDLDPNLDPDLALALQTLLKQRKALEEQQLQNEEELQQEVFWRQELKEETRRAAELSARLQQLHWSLHHQTQRLSSLVSHSEALQSDTHTHTEAALQPLKLELQERHLQAQSITAALEEMQRQKFHTDAHMRTQRQLLDDLNKELRQWNLQQFILQASGSTPSDIQSANDSGPIQSANGSGPTDVTNIYLSNAGIME